MPDDDAFVGFEWDPQKRRSNLAKHDVDFAAAALIFEGAYFENHDLREDYGEPRYVAVGVAKDRVLVVVWTPRGHNRRLISARLAEPDERREFDAYRQNRTD